VSRKPPVKPHAKSGGDDPPNAAADVPLANSQSYVALIADLKRRITDARLRAALSVNRELVLLYWSIGQDILSREKSEGRGTKVIDRLAVDLGRAFPEMTGLSARNLKYSLWRGCGKCRALAQTLLRNDQHRQHFIIRQQKRLFLDFIAINTAKFKPRFRADFSRV
jgi:hypothetical protein